jgi:hypothetical protein
MAFSGHFGSTAALANTLTLATAINCIGIGFQRGTHTRWLLVANDGIGAPTLTDMGASYCHRDGRRADPFHRRLTERQFSLGGNFGALVAAICLVVFGGLAAHGVAPLYGSGSGILTIAKGAQPLALPGLAGYCARLGWRNAPARVL